MTFEMNKAKFPLFRPSRNNLKGYIHSPYEENEIIKQIRDSELNNPAPFSDRTFIEFVPSVAEDYELPYDYKSYSEGKLEEDKTIDIPVCNILGVLSGNNQDNYERYNGNTFREVLFENLHGLGLTAESAAFLISNESKDLDMPHRPIPNEPKSRSSLGMDVTQHGEWFYVNNGQQRVIFAMYLIWQHFGNKGLLKNVTVHPWIPR